MTSTAEAVREEIILDKRAADGSRRARVSLDPTWFGVRPNVPLIHQVVVAQQAARRSGTQSTKTRAEVAGGGAKPYRQKGTGRARQGSNRAPHFEGGGVAHAPKPRSYHQRTPRKMVRLALAGALSDRAAQRRVCLVDDWPFPVPKTKAAVAAIEALGLDGRILVVIGGDDVIAERSFDNLPYVDVIEGAQLTAYHVMCADWVVFNDATIPGETTVLETYESDSSDDADVADAGSETADDSEHGGVDALASDSADDDESAGNGGAADAEAEQVSGVDGADAVEAEAVSSADGVDAADADAEDTEQEGDGE
jgi:large subunit ribosomal protein L4